VSKDNIDDIDNDKLKEMLEKKISEYGQNVKSIKITVNLVDE
jgi:hypothetical protein